MSAECVNTAEGREALELEALKAFLLPLLTYWQHMLRLDDWHIRWGVVPDGDDVSYWAKIKVQTHHYCADMEIVNPVDGRGMNDDLAEQFESSLVHELLHLRYPSVLLGLAANDTPQNCTYEAATDITARALVAARRGIERLNCV